ncbi:MAG: circadian clock protein KaiB [Actinobacteria bacterium]|nr:circadian clock protein KaiB [Actinomycetota bacterium]
MDMSASPEIQLTLYVTGRSQRSQTAISRAKELASSYSCKMEIIDVLEEGRRAQQDDIITTPTLIKASPPPVKRFIGDLTSLKAVRNALALPKPPART